MYSHASVAKTTVSARTRIRPRRSWMSDSAPKHLSGEQKCEVKDMKYWTNRMGQFIRKIRRSTRKRRKYSWESMSFDSEFDDLEGQAVHYRPESIDALCRVTKFNKRELKSMYRGFKQECPTGVVREETFKEIYARFFPRGADSSQYAHYVFNTFDQDSSGALSFEDFVVGLSVLARGSLHEKLRWAFTLYDINGDGFITKDELGDIVNAIYDLMGRCSDPVIDDTTTKDHVDKVFQKLDMNKDGVVTIEEFMDYCSRDESIKKSISALNTVL